MSFFNSQRTWFFLRCQNDTRASTAARGSLYSSCIFANSVAGPNVQTDFNKRSHIIRSVSLASSHCCSSQNSFANHMHKTSNPARVSSGSALADLGWSPQMTRLSPPSSIERATSFVLYIRGDRGVRRDCRA
jgi:Tfp pilus assembly protein PilV